MKDFYVRDAAQFENKIITTSFVVASKQVKPKKSGEPYLALTLADRTGHIDAKVWDNVADMMATGSCCRSSRAGFRCTTATRRPTLKMFS